ncbi:MAG: hypothetical protein A3C07_04425 [Candidatus Sungbacteria bacterium RIFCSPHIGHO2_02_FULL_47_11]|uniref:30S ribosomal protein S21 n=1 Tax=Candidatus Sungbacteria bacterium RIFCSPHIGHO2_02_FULL_47_11 TaxID=1802270 RepID=A0A1G2KJ69_9BACT|nr:MAG: hypothetical protein A3C07_04425 [Candidatus Sungbacteria bacterium RIFCSPHIGHO2_02_FULL_47_11]
MLRRFTRKIQMSGTLLSARKRQFYHAHPTKRNMRERALRRIIKTKEIRRLEKLGKLDEVKK